MKKTFAFLMSVALLAGCSGNAAQSAAGSASEQAASSSAAEEKTEEVQKVGIYTIYNATGEGITELYLYPAGSAEKGDNYAAGGHGFADAHAMVLQYDASADPSIALTLEFTTQSGYKAQFDTLHIETAPITLLAADALTGSTPLTFAANKATYTIYNTTGEKVTDLYLYRTGSDDKGENLIAGAAENGGSQEITFDAVPDFLIDENGKMGAFTIEFTTESGYTGSFKTLSYENAPICLISADAMTGATEIKFGVPQN